MWLDRGMARASVARTGRAPRRLAGGGSLTFATVALALAIPGFGPGLARPPGSVSTRIIPTDYRGPFSMPALVFVSRAPLPGGGVPGLGPGQRAAISGGRLLVREPNGRMREVLPPGTMFDVSDPAVSFDGRRIAFAGVVRADSAWRIFVVGVDGRGLRAVTWSDRTGAADAARFARYDDLDPCWIDDHLICFASTRYPLRAQYADLPATNLFVIDADAGGAPRRITSERNGAEEPALDPRSGEIVFSRWWFNRFRTEAAASAAATGAPHRVARDTVNLWQAIALTPDGLKLRCGSVTSRRAMMAYQIAFLGDGTPIATCALNLGLWPRPGPLGLQRFGPRGAAVERIAGAVIPDSAVGGYSESLGLASPGACAPAALPDGRVVFAHDPGGRGDYGLWIVRPGGRARELLNLPGTLELDPAPIVIRDRPRVRPHVPAGFPDARPATLADLDIARPTFDYQSLGVFRSGPAAPGAAANTAGASIRFYAAPLVDEGGARDTLVLIRELPLSSDGRVDARGLPADVPLFEHVVDSSGRLLRAAHGSTQVAGFNAGAPGGRSRCVGCHLGHSALPVPAR